jgi:hypothetical protein
MFLSGGSGAPQRTCPREGGGGGWHRAPHMRGTSSDSALCLSCQGGGGKVRASEDVLVLALSVSMRPSLERPSSRKRCGSGSSSNCCPAPLWPSARRRACAWPVPSVTAHPSGDRTLRSHCSYPGLSCVRQKWVLSTDIPLARMSNAQLHHADINLGSRAWCGRPSASGTVNSSASSPAHSMLATFLMQSTCSPGPARARSHLCHAHNPKKTLGVTPTGAGGTPP